MVIKADKIMVIKVILLGIKVLGYCIREAKSVEQFLKAGTSEFLRIIVPGIRILCCSIFQHFSLFEGVFNNPIHSNQVNK